MKKRFYEVYLSGYRSLTQYYQKFENAYRAWVTMAASNEVIEEILMSGITKEKEKEENEGIFLNFGGCILESTDFEDGEGEEE